MPLPEDCTAMRERFQAAAFRRSGLHNRYRALRYRESSQLWRRPSRRLADGGGPYSNPGPTISLTWPDSCVQPTPVSGRGPRAPAARGREVNSRGGLIERVARYLRKATCKCRCPFSSQLHRSVAAMGMSGWSRATASRMILVVDGLRRSDQPYRDSNHPDCSRSRRSSGASSVCEFASGRVLTSDA